MISVITPSVRQNGLDVVEKALKRQTFQDFEWLIGSPFIPTSGTHVVDDFKGGYWSLNRIYNKLIDRSDGELLVSWQDYTSAGPQTLEKFWYHFQNEPKTLVTAVGNKYKDDMWTVQTWQDPRQRQDQGSFYRCFPNDIEWNLCSVPKQAVYDVGGFDEQMDFMGYGMDALGVNERIDTYGGYDFKIDQTIVSFSLVHDRPKDWDKNNLLNGGYNERKKSLIDNGEYPTLEYLKRTA